MFRKEFNMTVKAKLLVDVSMDIDDPLASEETLRYLVEQDLEDCGFNVEDVSVVDGTVKIHY